jgi:hypothetical protein
MSHHLEVVSGGTWRDAGIPGVVLLRLFLIFFAPPIIPSAHRVSLTRT